jgi:hypothetical protein
MEQIQTVLKGAARGHISLCIWMKLISIRLQISTMTGQCSAAVVDLFQCARIVGEGVLLCLYLYNLGETEI